MNKIRIKQLKCFKQVADVIGEDNAQVELLSVLYTDRCWVQDKEDIIDSLVWHESKQGWEFWDDIDDGVIPDKYCNKF